MKFSLAFLTLAVASVNAGIVQKRDDQDATSLTGPRTITATKVAPSLVDFEPFMISVTSEVVWTQFPTPTSSA
ncbi:hypothetical protein K435DRAFT_969239 [Dendrothele bispora CBS 962.96]|uniref:Uncharacterized protein n=1 Tax=Dendrothele bispora (strain CBS 962.96) TaxID=1314807 RepID=A0A4S8LJ40_DENBC|nr:hypothetical protein K435DRAFT_969239 [Dendrothele bispora CBS 962.96]